MTKISKKAAKEIGELLRKKEATLSMVDTRWSAPGRIRFYMRSHDKIIDDLRTIYGIDAGSKFFPEEV